MDLNNDQTYRLNASEATTAQRDADNLSYVWFTDRSSQPLKYFSLTKSHENESFYSERDDQKWGAYGGLKEVAFDDDKLTIHYEKSSAERLGGAEAIVIDCRGLSQTTRAQVATTLAYILAGSNIALTTA